MNHFGHVLTALGQIYSIVDNATNTQARVVDTISAVHKRSGCCGCCYLIFAGICTMLLNNRLSFLWDIWVAKSCLNGFENSIWWTGTKIFVTNGASKVVDFVKESQNMSCWFPHLMIISNSWIPHLVPLRNCASQVDAPHFFMATFTHDTEETNPLINGAHCTEKRGSRQPWSPC